MANEFIQFDIEPDPDIRTLLREFREDLQTSIVSAHEDTLEGAEDLQVKLYTQSGNPPKPSGSRYRRTFKTRRTSRTQVFRRQLPLITGAWVVKAKWASYVLGLEKQQAAIHRKRWKSLEITSEGVEVLYPENLDRRLDEVRV